MTEPTMVIRAEDRMIAAYVRDGTEEEILVFTMTPKQARQLARALRQKATQIEGFWWTL